MGTHEKDRRVASTLACPTCGLLFEDTNPKDVYERVIAHIQVSHLRAEEVARQMFREGQAKW